MKGKQGHITLLLQNRTIVYCSAFVFVFSVQKESFVNKF